MWRAPGFDSPRVSSRPRDRRLPRTECKEAKEAGRGSTIPRGGGPSGPAAGAFFDISILVRGGKDFAGHDVFESVVRFPARDTGSSVSERDDAARHFYERERS